MTRKPTTKSPEERRLRKQLRDLLKLHAADQSRNNTDHVIRELLALIDDEVRRTRMSMAPAVQDFATNLIRQRERLQDQQMFTCGGK